MPNYAIQAYNSAGQPVTIDVEGGDYTKLPAGYYATPYQAQLGAASGVTSDPGLVRSMGYNQQAADRLNNYVAPTGPNGTFTAAQIAKGQQFGGSGIAAPSQSNPFVGPLPTTNNPSTLKLTGSGDFTPTNVAPSPFVGPLPTPTTSAIQLMGGPATATAPASSAPLPFVPGLGISGAVDSKTILPSNLGGSTSMGVPTGTPAPIPAVTPAVTPVTPPVTRAPNQPFNRSGNGWFSPSGGAFGANPYINNVYTGAQQLQYGPQNNQPIQNTPNGYFGGNGQWMGANAQQQLQYGRGGRQGGGGYGGNIGGYAPGFGQTFPVQDSSISPGLSGLGPQNIARQTAPAPQPAQGRSRNYLGY